MKAKQYFKEAITMSKNEQSFLMLAKIFIKEGNTNTAIEILQKANELFFFKRVFYLKLSQFND